MKLPLWHLGTPCSRATLTRRQNSHTAAAARTAGYLTAVGASSVVVDVDELVGAKSLSQRYRFLARLASRLPGLAIVLHDDACHSRLMGESQLQRTHTATILATAMCYVVDSYHAPGHVGVWCAEHCLPHLPANKFLLDGFTTNICEVMNSELHFLRCQKTVQSWSC